MWFASELVAAAFAVQLIQNEWQVTALTVNCSVSFKYHDSDNCLLVEQLQ